jgi:hypothetical protein
MNWFLQSMQKGTYAHMCIIHGHGIVPCLTYMGSTSTLSLLASEGIFLGDKQGRVIDLGQDRLTTSLNIHYRQVRALFILSFIGRDGYLVGHYD